MRSAAAFFAAAASAAAFFAAFSAAAFLAALSLAVEAPVAAFSAVAEDVAAVGCASLCPPVAVMAVTEPAATSTAAASLWERVMRMVRGMRSSSCGDGACGHGPREQRPRDVGRDRRRALVAGSVSVLAGIHG